jgi:hypothetical protein
LGKTSNLCFIINNTKVNQNFTKPKTAMGAIKKSTIISKEDSELLKRLITKDDRILVAGEHGVTPAHVMNIIIRDRNNDAIAARLLKIARRKLKKQIA